MASSHATSKHCAASFLPYMTYNPIAVMASSHATSKHCAASFVPSRAFSRNCAPTLALFVIAWHHDHDGATRFAVEMCSTEVVEPPSSHVSRRSSGSRHASTEHESEALMWRRCRTRGVSSGVNSLTRFGFLGDQPGSNQWLCCVTFVCSPDSLRWLSGTSWWTCNIRMNSNSSLAASSTDLRIQRQSSRLVVVSFAIRLYSLLRLALLFYRRSGFHSVIPPKDFFQGSPQPSKKRHCRTDRWCFAILDANRQLCNNWIAIGQEGTELLRCRHLNSKYISSIHAFH